MDHWAQHKAHCKLIKAERKCLTAESGLKDPLSDLLKWMQYYDAVLKNCAVASFEMKQFHREHLEKTVFMVRLSHRRDPSLPIQDRFSVINVSTQCRESLPLTSHLYFDLRQRAKFVEIGKQEYGENYYGTGLYVVQAECGQDSLAIMEKFLSIDKHTANAKVLRKEWWLLFREYVKASSKLRFCCGRVGGVCCCGGWTHPTNETEKDFQATMRDLNSSG
ncbi:hypothetical protein BT96DRAFT_1016474 [Gymnopus androsaceus JB14]|uniref:MYND-type domain-containing protein n=1 Tax=Gymnopus androsaceus JB14 TaxID=1447944 RepID=A0A6A4I690_9AGAR|nr:hypothetical protein BT96DRAFT_1016474 [Gymnopus androsaceus JB14]